MMKDFIVNETYFRVTYTESGFLYPLVETFIYVGMNLSDGDVEDIWYFQFALDYARFGSILEDNGNESKVTCLSENDLEDMLDMPSLVLELNESAIRRSNVKNKR